MSPNEMDKYRNDFCLFCNRFGWYKKVVKMEHERDWDCSWDEDVWFSSEGERLFSESDLEEGLVKELIRIYEVLTYGG